MIGGTGGWDERGNLKKRLPVLKKNTQTNKIKEAKTRD